MMTNEVVIAHHGIKGQHWGIRRFQNEDGTRTAAGKKRENSAFKSAMASRKRERVKAGSGSLFNENKSTASLKYQSSKEKYQNEGTKDAKSQKAKDFKASKASLKANKTVGQKAANFLLNGPIGAGVYNNMRASGHSVARSEAVTVASFMLGGPIGHTAAYLITRKGA